MTAFDPALLTGRTASCTCGLSMPSVDATTQPFFEYRGPGTSDDACRKCGYFRIAHEYDARRVSPEPVPATRDHQFEPRSEGYPTDTFYCGDFNKHPAGLD